MGYRPRELQRFPTDPESWGARRAAPDALIDDVDLIGPKERIRERLAAWREAGRKRHLDTPLLETGQPEALELLAEDFL